METNQALKAFTALSQETRLNVFKVLIEYGQTGAAAGEISERLGIPQNTLSFHLSHLSHADLVSSRRVGRSIIYSANCKLITDLIHFLTENCCVLESNKTQKSRKKCCPSKPNKGARK